MTIKPREYFINFSTVNDRASLHAKLKACLGLPDWYGANLDALYDCLTDLGPCVISLAGLRWLEPLGAYGKKLLQVFRDAEADSGNLTVVFTD